MTERETETVEIGVQHDAHIDAYWNAERGFIRMQLCGGLNPFTGKPEFERRVHIDRDDLGLSPDY